MDISTQKNYYRVAANVDLDAVNHNLEELKKHLAPGTMTAAVLKADAYGHGAVYMARALDAQVDAICVATAEEAINMRQNGVVKPIVVLSFANEAFLPVLIVQDIRVNVFRLGFARKISEVAVRMDKTARIHISVDTGMGRLGFAVSEDSVQEVLEISRLPGIFIEGICTHFSGSDEADKTSANRQLERFNWFISRLREEGLEIPICHCSNSAAAMEMPQANMNMVRLGIALYGYYPSEEVDRTRHDLRPAMTLVSHVISLKTLEPGMGVSYGSTFVAERATRVAVIPVGYGDGYPRALSNKGYVLIRGQRAPILGRVCMDLVMVDVTDIPGVQMGEQVTLMGRDGAEELWADTIGAWAGTFHYEFLCDLSKRIPRVYYSAGREVASADYFSTRF